MPRVQRGYSVPVGGELGGGSEPFRGVRPFGTRDADLFFGRRKELDALLAMLDRPESRLVTLFGKHGVGKSSLLLAGLIPRLLRSGYLPVYVDGRQEPRAALKQAVFQESARPPRGDEDAVSYALRVTEAFPEGMVVLFDDVSDRLDGDGLAPLVETVEALLAAERPVRCLFCIDSGAFHRLAEVEQELHRSLAPECRFRLDSLGAKEAETAIEEGVLASGLYFEQGLSKTMAEDLTRKGPVLPLDLQLAVTRAIERRCLTVKRYVRAGGAAVFQAEWLRARVREAGPIRGLRVLSELADRRAGAPGWITPAELGQATGVSPEHLASILDVYARHAMLARDETDGEVRVRLAPPALVPLIRELDGRLRARRLRARLVLRKRLVAGGVLRPRELWKARRLPLPGEQERQLLRRSWLLWGGALALLVGGLMALLVWLQISGSRGAHLDLQRSAVPGEKTVVLRRGDPRLGRFARFPVRPAVGAVVLDTGLRGQHVLAARRASLREVYGPRGERRGRFPAWFVDLRTRLDAIAQGVVGLLLGPPAPAWSALGRIDVTRPAGREALRLVSWVGTGAPAERALVASRWKRASAFERGAIAAAAIQVALRRPGAYKALLDRAARDADPGVRQVVLDRAARFPPRQALHLAALAVDARQPGLRERALPLALRHAARAPRDAAVVLAACLEPPASAPETAQARLGLERLLASHPAAAVSGLVARLAKARTPGAQQGLLAMLSRAPDNQLPAALGPPLITLAASSDRAVAGAALRLAARVADPKALEARLKVWAADARHASHRARAATGFGALLRRGHKVDLAPLRRLVGDNVVAVRVAAVRALGAAPLSEYFTVMRVGMDRSTRVRAALMQTLAEMGHPDPYKIIRPLQSMSQGGGTRLRAALTTAAARLVRTKQYWSIAKNFVVQATHDAQASVRRAGVEALGRIGHLRRQASLAALKARLKDSSVKVRTAVVDAAGRIARKAPVAAGLLLVALVSDPAPVVALRALILVSHLAGTPGLQAALGAALPGALRSSAEGVRTAAVALLSRLPVGKTSTRLDQALAVAYQRASSAADRAQVLAEAARHQAPAALAAAARSPDAAERRRALSLIRRTPAAAHVPTVLAALSHPDPAVRRAALSAAAPLLRLAPAKLLPPLLRLSADPSSPCYGAALQALGSATTSLATVRKRLQRAASQPDGPVREAVARAYGQLRGSEAALAPLLRDPALRVRRAAVRSLARWWAARPVARLVRTLRGSPRDRQRRLAAALAAHQQLAGAAARAAATRKALEQVHRGHDPLAALLAGAALAVAPTPEGREDLVALLDLLFLF